MFRKINSVPMYLFVSLLMLSSTLVNAQSVTFNHPGLLNNTSELQFIKTKIKAGEEPWKTAYERLKSKISLSYRPSPRTNVPNDASTQDVMTTDGSTAYACALIWYFSDDARYSTKATEILNAWSVFNSHPNWLYLSWAVPQFLNAAEILRHTPNSGWSSASIQKFNTMVRAKFLPPMQNTTWVNNAMMSTIEGQIACAIYLDDRGEFTRAVDRWRMWIPNYIYISSDGSKPKLVGRTTIGYWGTGTNESFINGACQETCRDLNHAKMGTYSLMYGAEMAWHQNVDLWKEEKERFISFAELHAGWMIGATTVPSWICNREGIWCQGQVSWGTPSGHPPCNPASWEMIKNHYVTRLGLGSRLPLTVKMTVAQRPSGAVNDRNGKFNTLTHANLVYGTTPAAPEINVKQGTAAIASGTGQFIYSGTTNVGASSAAITFTIQNSGNAVLNVSQIVLSGTDANQFILSALTDNTIDGTGTATFNIAFKPTSTGSKTASVKITSNDQDENPFSFTLKAASVQQTVDCAGVPGGSAAMDGCGICSGGTTGKVPTHPTTWYQDADGDSYGDPARTLSACAKPAGYVSRTGDACPADPFKTTPGNCGCNKAENSCVPADTASILGVACGAPNKVLNFTLNPARRGNVEGCSWWLSGGGNAVTSADGFSANVTLSQYFTSGKVCAGVRLKAEPYYVQYCKSITTCGTRVTEEAAELNSESIKIYPNPASSDYVVIDATGLEAIPNKIQLINNYGEILYEARTTGDQTTLPVLHFPEGTYTLKLQFDQKSTSQKLVIVR